VSDTPVIDLGEAYRQARLRICAMVNADNAALVVPATPEWNVHDVLAHLAGITEDALSGNMDGVTTDAWTAAQVERGRSKSSAELIEMWSANAPLVEVVLSSPEGVKSDRAVIDIHTHEVDLLHALGRPIAVPEDVLSWVTGRLRSDFDCSVAQVGLPAVEVRISDFEWFRGRLGRRTVDEVCAYEWSADPAPYLACWFVFGRAERSLGEVLMVEMG